MFNQMSYLPKTLFTMHLGNLFYYNTQVLVATSMVCRLSTRSMQKMFLSNYVGFFPENLVHNLNNVLK